MSVKTYLSQLLEVILRTLQNFKDAVKSCFQQQVEMARMDRKVKKITARPVGYSPFVSQFSLWKKVMGNNAK